MKSLKSSAAGDLWCMSPLRFLSLLYCLLLNKGKNDFYTLSFTRKKGRSRMTKNNLMHHVTLLTVSVSVPVFTVGRSYKEIQNNVWHVWCITGTNAARFLSSHLGCRVWVFWLQQSQNLTHTSWEVLIPRNGKMAFNINSVCSAPKQPQRLKALCD